MKDKLTSRKLWIAVAGIIAGIAMIAAKNTVEGTSMIISSVIGYLVAESYIDAKAVGGVIGGIVIPAEPVEEPKSEE